jgi:hypothetical protein
MLPEEIIGKKMLPSHMIMDNIFFYGECESLGIFLWMEKKWTFQYITDRV